MSSSKPRILFDSSRLINRLTNSTPTGIDRVDLEYAKYFLRSEEFNVVFVAYGKKGHFILPDLLVKYAISKTILDWETRSGKAYLASAVYFIIKLLRWSSVLGLPRHPSRVLSNEGAPALYLNISHGKLTKSKRFEWLKEQGVLGLFFVHDLIPVLYPEFCIPKQQSKHRERLKTIGLYGYHLIVNSICTKQDLEEYLKHEYGNTPAIDVLPLGVEVDRHIDFKINVDKPDKPYFVVLSTIEPRKNHLMLLKVWKRLFETLGSDAPKLVILGRRGWENQEVFDMLDHDADLRSLVVERPGLNDVQVASILGGSRALLSPSFAEGYGLPVVEALSSGVSVLASDIPAHREIGQGVPDFLEAGDEDAWYEAVLNYAKYNSTEREHQLSRIQNYSAPSWAEHFENFSELLRKLLNEKGAEPR